jgi:23S rRNA pseudouridine1911/1915/1917 synthase
MRTLTLIIPPELDGRQVKSVLKNRLCLARGLIARIKLRENGIILNGSRARTVDIVHAGDLLAVEISDAPSAVPATLPAPEIAWEDEDIAVINKPAGVASHGSGAEPSVADMLASYLGASPHIITRLDRGTSGLMLFAKNAYMTERLRRELHSENLCRRYLALCVGAPEPRRGEVRLPIARISGSCLRCVSADGKEAATLYETLAVSDNASLVRLRLLTGRTHQIRVHMSAIGCPLLGDAMYGSKSELIARPALHSAELTLRHPLSGELLNLFSQLPQDMRDAAGALEISLHNL